MDPKPKSVAELAYELWQARGSPHGSPELDWHDAERQLSAKGAVPPAPAKPGAKSAAAEARVDESEMGSFPASDPPASHGTDEPPSNAAAKWKAAGIDRAASNASNSGGGKSRGRRG